jgi:nucleotide-binding universal stress UspA family protein
MFKHILIPTDGSELSRSAITTGVAVAKACSARVTGITVVVPLADFGVGEFGSVADPEPYSRDSAANAKRALAVVSDAAAQTHVSAETVQLAHDKPWQAIIDTAASKGCDLIVMASHGRRGLDALVLGSETNKVLTHSKIPVLVTR